MTMMPTTRSPLGMSLQDILLKQQQMPTGGMPEMPPGRGMTEDAKKPGFMAPGSKGAIIAGILGDALSRASGGQAVFMPMEMQRRQQEQASQAAEAKWHRDRQAAREDKQWEWQNKPQDPAPMMRDAMTWQSMSPQQRQAYQEMSEAKSGPVTTVLPNGQLYVGPRAGLAQAITGQAASQALGSELPEGWTVQGGPASAPGGFRR